MKSCWGKHSTSLEMNWLRTTNKQRSIAVRCGMKINELAYNVSKILNTKENKTCRKLKMFCFFLTILNLFIKFY